MEPKRKKVLCLIPGYITDSEITGRIKESNTLSEISCLALYKGYAGKYGIENLFDVNDEETRIRLMADIRSISKIAVVTPSAAFMKNVLSGDDKCYFCDMVNTALVHGIPVEIYAGFPEQAAGNGSRFSALRDAVLGLKQMGIRMIFDKQIAAAQGLTLVTEAEVLAALKDGLKEISCAKGCIVTPQASDTARDKGIIIRR